MNMRKFLVGGAYLLAAFVVLLPGYVLAQSTTYDKSLYEGMKWRLVGPFRGGRVESVAGIPNDPLTYYMGSVGGGVWKTSDAGQTWDPLWNHEPVASIGSVAVSYSDPNIVYVGTGEPCPRGDATYGDGIYKSTDAGKTWIHLGLDDTRHIGKILVDPHDPNRVFVAALGHVYGPNQERGVFRTLDGGKTWTKILYKNDTTGAADLIFDGNNTQILYASLWTLQRTPWHMTSRGSPDDGLYKSTDGGDTWTKLGGQGWPVGMLGKIGVAVSAADPNRVYALVEAMKDEKGLYRSDDGGQSWQLMNNAHYFMQRPWYFTHVWADPLNTDTVYVQDLGVYRSTDDGKTFEWIKSVPHGDNHALWIAPNNSNRMIVGNDGGATISNDYGKTWSTIYNQPTAQFYHISADNLFDYHIYGAQQDNSTIAIATRTRHRDISSADYYSVGGGESASIFSDPADPDLVYATDKETSFLRVYDKRTEQDQDVSEWPASLDGWGAKADKYRFNWEEPVAISPFDPHTIYHGSNVLFESTDDGQNWKIISPDLSRDDESKQQRSGGSITGDNATIEIYDLIYSVVESPLQKGLIWVGTDDGLVWVTRDGGGHWQNVTPPGLPPWSKVSMVEASPHVAGGVYIAVNRYKNDDLKPYAWKTDDYGKTWTSITNGIPSGSFLRVVAEDSVRRGLLFAGTETGVYVSFNDGAYWQPLQMNLPVASVRDLIIHGDDLAVATHGRAFWILDDIAPLRQIDPQVADSDAFLYKPAITYRVRRTGGLANTDGGPVAENPPDGAMIDYYLKSAPASEVTVDILDTRGKVIRHFSNVQPPAPKGDGGVPDREVDQGPLPVKEGINRYVWDLRYAPPTRLVTGPHPAYGGVAIGPYILPGMYEVRLTVNGKTMTQPLQVKMDPLVKTSEAELAKQMELGLKLRDSLDSLISTVNQIVGVQRQTEVLLHKAGSESPIAEKATSLNDQMSEIVNALYQPEILDAEDAHNYPVKLRIQFITLQHFVDSADTGPLPQAYVRLQELTQELDAQLAKWKALQAQDIPVLNKMAAAAGLGHLDLNAAASPAPPPVGVKQIDSDDDQQMSMGDDDDQ
jgi:photosystem II stability/assembly factor-like uncharacterized protein